MGKTNEEKLKAKIATVGGEIRYQIEAHELTANSAIYWDAECTGGKFSKLFAEYGNY